MPSFIEYLYRVQSDVEKPLNPWHQECYTFEQITTYWSTDFKTPVIERSFFNSTVTVWSVRVLKTEKMSFPIMLVIYLSRIDINQAYHCEYR